MHVSRTPHLSGKAAPLLGLAALAALGLPHAALADTANYSFGVFNNSATAQVETFTFFQPVVTQLPAGTTVNNTLSGTIRDSSGGIVSISPSGQTFVADALINLTDAGFGVGTAQTSGPGAGPFNYGPFTTSGVYASPINSIGINMSFLLSAGGIALLNGTVSTSPTVITSTPEPSSIAAFAFTALGVSGLLLRARRRQKPGV